MRCAALMIDIQKCWTDKYPAVQTAIHKTLPALRRHMDLVWIYYDWGMLDRSPKPARRKTLHPIFNRVADTSPRPGRDEYVAFKFEPDAFSNGYLKPFLRQRYDRLYLCGFLADACVLETARSAARVFDTRLLSPLTTGMEDDRAAFRSEGVKIVDRQALEFLLR